jgi:beta-phosphoglucomutase
MKRHTCALFDLDGVIVDTAKYHFLAWKKIATMFGYELTPSDNEELKGVSRSDSLNIILKLAQTTLDDSNIKRYLIQKNEDYLKHIEDINPQDVLPGIFEVLTILKEKKVKIGLGSASKNASIILDRLELTSFFDVIIDGNHVDKSKPHPEVFLRGSEALGVNPSQCVVFEDSSSGILAAKAAGMTAVAIGAYETFTKQDYCYPNFLPLVQRGLGELF